MEGNGKRNRATSKRNLTSHNSGLNVVSVNKDKLPLPKKADGIEKPDEKNTEQALKQVAKKSVKHNLEFLDTNVPINNWRVMRDLIKAGNTVVLPITLIKELDKLKNIDRTHREAMKALREIDRLQTEGNPFLIIESGMLFTRMNLDKTNPDHQIIATLNYIAYHASHPGDKYFGFDAIKMITDDYTVKILAREVNQKSKVIVEPYLKNRVKIADKDLDIPVFYVGKDDIIRQGDNFVFLLKGNLKSVPDGSPMIGYSDKNFKDCGEFCAIRQDEKFLLLSENIQAFGVSRLDLKVNHRVQTNWGQIIALHYLLNPKISCVFMHGATGSGKTLLALAAGMELKRQGFYPKIVVYRIPESAYGDTSAALPGDVGQKIAPWTEPILQALSKLLKINRLDAEEAEKRLENNPLDNSSSANKRQKRGKNNANAENGNGNDNAKSSNGKPSNGKTPPPQRTSALKVFVDELFEKHKVEIKVLDYVRGITLDDAFIIVDDSQNLNKKNIKDVITRAGKNAKIVFTGDLNQIDNKYIDKESSGLSHAIIKMKELGFVGIVSLPVTVRSQLAAAADKLL
jgi:predicted ribonuclease YlaK